MILAVLGTGLAVGLANGLVFVLGRIPHPFIVTLASLSIVRGIALWAGHGTLLPGMPPFVDTVGGGSIDWLPYSFFVVVALALMTVVLTTRMVWGRWLYAVGGDPDGARRAGIPVGRVLISVYALSGLAAGIGGLLTAGPDRRRLADGRRSRRARLDRGGDHRRRRLRGRPRQRRQRARRRLHHRA